MFYVKMIVPGGDDTIIDMADWSYVVLTMVILTSIQAVVQYAKRMEGSLEIIRVY
jgi:hypothetical protein